MSRHQIIVIGASAGGIEAASRIFAGLPADFPGSIFIVVHIPAHALSVLPQIFTRSGRLPAVHPIGTQAIRPGVIYVAPPDTHLILGRGTVSLTAGPKENGHRPAVDPLFRSAALAYGPAALGIILSGSLDDGAAGLAAIKEAGGLAIAQASGDALYPSMPRHAADAVDLDHVLPADEIGTLLARLARESPTDLPRHFPSSSLVAEVGFDALDPAVLHGEDHPGIPSGFGCPDCGGALWEIQGQTPLRFRCRVGHAWTIGSLMADQADKTESALWTALRTLEERASLCRKLVERFRSSGNPSSAARFQTRVDEFLASAEVLRRLIASSRPLNLDEGNVPSPSPSPSPSPTSTPPSPVAPADPPQTEANE